MRSNVPGLTTSQFVTAPKQCIEFGSYRCSLTTSQFVTAPKPQRPCAAFALSLTTSQFVTAPKLLSTKTYQARV